MGKSTGKFNILHIDTEKQIGGGEKQLKLLIENLPSLFRSVVAVRKKSEVENLFSEAERINFSGGFDPIALIRLIRLVKKENIHIVHAHTGVAANYAILLKPFVKATIATRRVSVPIKNPISKIKYKLLDRVVVVSREIKMDFLSNVTWIESAIEEKFADCPLKEDAKELLGIDKNRRYICNVGKIDYMKGQDILLKALSMLNLKDIHLIIAGSGEIDKLRNMAKELGISDRVVFTGYLKDTRPVYAASELCVISSRFGEGSQGALKEALSCGIPVVATAMGSAKYLISESNGILVEPGNPEMLAEAIEKLLNRKPNVSFEKQDFSPKEMANRYASLYLQLLKNS